MRWTVGVDIGGTFTDFCVVGNRQALLWKEPSTPERPEQAIESGLVHIADKLNCSLEEFLGDVEAFFHGSTIAINAILQAKGPKVGLICTRGFRDLLYLRDGFKWDRFNPRLPHPGTFVDRGLRIGVNERIDARGKVLRALDTEEVREVARTFKRSGVGAIAVALLWSQVNPAHEVAIQEVLAQEIPDVPVMLSSQVLPEIGEWIRTSATTLAAYVYPTSRDYLMGLEDRLLAAGLREPLFIMQLNGGCSTVRHTLRFPVNMIGSGPSASPVAALRVASRVAARDVIAVDMGGTSFDVCLVRDGELPLSRELSVLHQPLGMAGVEVHSIGAGGGSIAWVDSGGALRVGPRSAGAAPGPVAYGTGGEEPTVTDANVVLGYLSSERFLDGRKTLFKEAAAGAIDKHVARPLGLSLMDAAAGILRVVNENMVNAIRVVSVERGIDPKPYLLVVGGGAGALHAGRLAEALGISRVMIPSEAGIMSAFGMTTADIRQDYTFTLHTTSISPDIAGVAGTITDTEGRAAAALEAEGFRGTSVVLERSVDARYKGQVHELITPVPSGDVDDPLFAAVAQRFHELHFERYGWFRLDYPIEYVHWRITARGVTMREPEPSLAVKERRPASAPTSRAVFFPEAGKSQSVPTFEAPLLSTGDEVTGPAVVDGSMTTIVAFPGHRLVALGSGNFLMETMGAGQ